MKDRLMKNCSVETRGEFSADSFSANRDGNTSHAG